MTRPVKDEERIASIDTMRGIALGGVLLINLLGAFRIPLSAHILGRNEPLGPGGSQLLAVLAALVEFKAFTLFSFLFGVGVGIQTKRVAGQANTPFLLRRFGALLIIGAAHLLFVWNGDILALYAVCGLLAAPLLTLPSPVLAALGLTLLAAQAIAPLPAPFPDDATLRGLTAGAMDAYRTGGLGKVFAFRWHETVVLVASLLMLSLPRTLGLMLLGVAAWRLGLLERNRRIWRWAIALGAGIGVGGLLLRNEQMTTVPLALAYAAAILLWNPTLPWLAAGGQMALTNYLLQSVVSGLVFYSYGLSWMGEIGVGAALAGGLVFYAVQLAGSRWWLRRFHFGPVEWLWRSVSYLRWQTFLRGSAHTGVGAAGIP